MKSNSSKSKEGERRERGGRGVSGVSEQHIPVLLLLNTGSPVTDGALINCVMTATAPSDAATPLHITHYTHQLDSDSTDTQTLTVLTWNNFIVPTCCLDSIFLVLVELNLKSVLYLNRIAR